jgi:hypothetical protein
LSLFKIDKIHIGKARGYDALREIRNIFKRVGWGSEIRIDYKGYAITASCLMEKSKSNSSKSRLRVEETKRIRFKRRGRVWR